MEGSETFSAVLQNPTNGRGGSDHQGRIKESAIDAAALGPFLKYAHVRTDKNFLEA